MQSSKPESNSFDLLAKPIRTALLELDFLEPTPPQNSAIEPILKGENVLLIAPTGTGKTEAVLLPIFSNLIQSPNRRIGISVLYVTPLRALNRDMLRRLEFWSEKLDITVEVRHGDTDLKLRKKQAAFPPDVLVTTPETLQAILPGQRMKQHLRHVQAVIVDEVHELASSKRGSQLTIALERLQELSGREFQRIGLSATVGNSKEVAKFTAGNKREIKIIETSPQKDYEYIVENPAATERDFEQAHTMTMAPEAVARIRRLLELVDNHKSTLIFVNSRTVAEMLGYKLNQLGRTDIAVHHGSMSREDRAQIEDDFKNRRLKAIICTSTLELGIDVGTVDLVVQYLSPRQVNSLIQRVGRSGHRQDLTSRGTIVTAFSDDTLESVAAIKNAEKNKLEPVRIHENALDVVAHQIVGILMDKGHATINEVMTVVKRAYPFRSINKETILDVVYFLDGLDQLRVEQEGKTVRKARRSHKYYYENLSMIPDERRYPIINIVSDRKIGTLGDEFMSLKARVGLNFIIKGKVWRIVQIEEETGNVYVVPSEDPLAAIPGWDGEMLPVPFELAQQTGRLRQEIADALETERNLDKTAAQIASRMHTDAGTIRTAVSEIQEHIRQGLPLPTDKRVVVEAYDKFLIIHACFGETVNFTLGCIFDTILSDREIILGWWNDGYRLLINTTRELPKQETQQLATTLFAMAEEDVNKAFSEHLEAEFPFAYKMKFIADRFGALPRGKTMGPAKLSRLSKRFANTPIYDETIREALIEKVDLRKVKEIMKAVRTGEITVASINVEKPSPLAYHILAKYSDVSELMAPEQVLMSNIEKMKQSIEARTATLLCVNCGQWSEREKIKNLPERPACEKCRSSLLTLVPPWQKVEQIQNLLRQRHKGQKLGEVELKELTNSRRMADLILSYGKKAIMALEVKGVGPETAFRVLGKMHPKEDEFYMDLLKAKIQYLRTREYWEPKDRQTHLGSKAIT